MAYIGTSPQNGVRNRFVYAATQGQTAFTGADSDGKTLAISDQLYTDVYQNGVKLKLTTDWTASSTTVTLVNAASVSDVIEILSFDVFSVSDTVPASTGGAFAGGVTFSTKLNVPTATTAPSSPSEGDVWFNSSASIVSGISSKALAAYNGTAWQKATTGIVMTATGGTKTTSGLFTIHTFTSSGTFSVSQSSGIIDFLVIAGGGGGGHDNGGGGGAGGVVWTTSANVATGNYTVTIGAGGAPSVAGGTNPAGSGANSIFKTATALGGGGAGGGATNGANGGSGGGGSRNRVGGSSTQGASGGTAFANRASASTNSSFEGGGGGGAGAAGTAGTSGVLGSGGIGVSTFVNSSATETTAFLLAALAGTDSSNVATTSSSSGTLYIAGGGAGGSQNSSTAATTAAGGGGPSVANTNATGVSGLVNTGSGGGSSGTGSGTGGSGGSGIVIIRYLTS